MIEIENSYGLVIPKNKLDSYMFDTIVADLTASDEQTGLTNSFYFIDKENIYIPRLSFHMESETGKFIKNECIIKDSNILKYHDTNKELFKDIRMKIEPRNEMQINTVKFLMESKKKDKSLFLSPGSGKTAMSIMYFVNNKYKPLILTPDKNLAKQWKDAILEFTNITEDQIFEFENGTASTKRKGFREEKLVYIACVKTFSSMVSKTDIEELRNLREMIDELKIDIKIIDECHLNLNAIFKTITWFPTIENLYLSATMNRRNIQENVIHPGIVEPIEVVETLEYEVKPKLMAILYDSNPSPGNVRYCQDMALRGAIDLNRYFNNYLLSAKNKDKLDVYLDMIENICFKYIRDSKDDYKHKVIIVAPSVKLLDVIYEKLASNYRVFRVYSKYKEKPKDNEFDIIIGTQQQVTAGFDVKTLDVMISISMLLSSHNVKQLLGRILRSVPGKKEGTYISLADKGFSAFMVYLRKLSRVCESELSKEHELKFTAVNSKFKFPKSKG